MDMKSYKEFLKANADKDYQWLSEQTGKTTESVRKMCRTLGLPPKKLNAQNTSDLTPEQQFQLDMEKMKLTFANKNVDQRYKVALGEISRLQHELEEVSTLKGTVSTYSIKKRIGVKHDAVAFAIASDWHVEENVKPETVDGTNEYTMRIAKQRAEAFFRNTLKLVEKEQQDASIDTLVLALLGDFISSNIHDELMESCEVPPIEAALFAQNLLASGIEYLLENSKLKLIVPCCVGNHSRITDKVHVSTEHGNSLEWMIYNNLARHFEKNKRVTFVLSKSYFTFVDVNGFLVRFHHGHAIKFGGGIGGLTVPVIKAISRYDVKRKASLDVFGHFHNRMDGGRFIVNGSLIGDSPYGSRLGFTGTPEQAFFLVDKVKGKTIVAPIFVG